MVWCTISNSFYFSLVCVLCISSCTGIYSNYLEIIRSCVYNWWTTGVQLVYNFKFFLFLFILYNLYYGKYLKLKIPGALRPFLRASFSPSLEFWPYTNQILTLSKRFSHEQKVSNVHFFLHFFGSGNQGTQVFPDSSRWKKTWAIALKVTGIQKLQDTWLIISEELKLKISAAAFINCKI